MREIKFRGKRLDNGEWVIAEMYQRCKNLFEEGYLCFVGSHTVDPETVGQYTGLKDKKGKEICEGDIVKQEYHKVTGSYDDYEVFDGHHLGKVVITANKGVCMYKPLCYSEEKDETERSNQYKTVAGYRCEVIGNIYANAELLELALAPPSRTKY